MLFLHHPIIRTQYPRNRGEEHRISTHERKERLRRRQDFPRHDDPASDDGGDDAAALDVDPSGEEHGEIIGGGDGIRGDVSADLGDVPARCGEEGGCSSAGAVFEPFGDDVEGGPDFFPVDDSCGGGGHNADDGAQCEDNRQHRQLDVLPFTGSCVS